MPPSLRAALRAAGPVDDVERWLRARWVDALWADDPDLRTRFPDPAGADRVDFRRWCTTEGVATGRLPLDAVRDEDRTELQDRLGVAVLGAGPLADSVRLAVSASGLPHAEQPVYPVVVCAGEPPVGLDRYLVAVRADPEPDSRADEVWTPAELPFPLADPGERDERDRRGARERLGFADEVVFAALLDHAAGADGGAVELVHAFGEAFADRTDARMIVYATPAADPDSAERARLAAASDPRIRLVDGPLDTDGVLAADWLVCLQRSGTPGSGAVLLDLAAAAARGVPVVVRPDGVAAGLLDGDNAVLFDDVELPGVLRDLVDDHGAAAKLGAAARDRVRTAFDPVAAGEVLRNRVERAYRTWRKRQANGEPEAERDPLQPLRAARHALLREPDVGVGYKIPMAPALRKAVLRVLNHYDAHLRTVLHPARRRGTHRRRAGGRPAVHGGPGRVALRADLDQTRTRAGPGREDDVRLGCAPTWWRTTATWPRLTTAVADEAAARRVEMVGLSERLDRLTGLLERTSGRIDAVEQASPRSSPNAMPGRRGSCGRPTQALQATDALRRVVVRAHERTAELDGDLDDLGTPTALVLCDAGLMRLPAEDSVMLPVLSSNGVWEPARRADRLADRARRGVPRRRRLRRLPLPAGAVPARHKRRRGGRRTGRGGGEPGAAQRVRERSDAVADRLAVVRRPRGTAETPERRARARPVASRSRPCRRATKTVTGAS